MEKVTARELKARSRIVLMSQLSQRDSLLVRTALQKLIGAEAEKGTDIQPVTFCDEVTDTLCLMVDGDVHAAIVFKTAAIADPLILDKEKDHAIVALELLWQSLQGLLLGRGASELFFGTPTEGDQDFRKMLERRGVAERLDSDRVHFFRREIRPKRSSAPGGEARG